MHPRFCSKTRKVVYYGFRSSCYSDFSCSQANRNLEVVENVLAELNDLQVVRKPIVCMYDLCQVVTQARL